MSSIYCYLFLNKLLENKEVYFVKNSFTIKIPIFPKVSVRSNLLLETTPKIENRNIFLSQKAMMTDKRKTTQHHKINTCIASLRI